MKYLRKDLLNPTLKEILEIFQMDKHYIRGEGSYLTDHTGRRYLDFIAQYGSVPFGYNPEFIWDKLNEIRTNKLPSFVQPSLPVEALKLANMLAECTPGDLSYCTFCQSGTEAVEAAIKLARSATGKEKVISTTNSFHGKTLGSLSATGKDSYQTPFRAPAPGFIRIPFNDSQALKEVLQRDAGNIAAFLVEPIQGEGGIIVAQPGYLQEVRSICDEYGVLLIVDEIQTGLGRTGKMFACDHEGIEPDIMVLAKALGGGILPIGVCISTPVVWNDDYGMLHSSTFANNNVTCAVGTVVLEKLLANNQEIIEEVAQKGEYLIRKLYLLAQEYPEAIKEVRGKGLMAAIEFYQLDDCGSYDMAFMADQGAFTILLSGFLLNVYNIRLAPYLNNSMTLRLEPTLTITYEQIDYVIEGIEKICEILTKRDFSRLYRYLIGDYSRPDKIVDYRTVSRKIKSSVLQNEEKPTRKFAFIVHYPAPEDVITNNPSFKSFTRDELYDFMAWQSRTDKAGIACHMPAIKSLDGTVAEGWLIGVPFGAREIMELPREQTVKVIKQAVDKGRDLGVGIVGLGALSSVVTKGGRSVTGRGVAITSGNSFTILMAMEALLCGAKKMHLDLNISRGAVVGATGSIGRACALLLSERLSNITLLGNPKHVNSSRNRLNSLFEDIFAYAHKRMTAGEFGGLSGWLKMLYQTLERDESELSQQYREMIQNGDKLSIDVIESICDHQGINCPLKTSLDITRTLPECDMIVAASNSPEYIIFSQHLKPGAVVCDVARPADVAPEVGEKRNDVLILEGGLVQYPDAVAFGPNLGYRDGVNLACLSETILLALEGDYQDYSIGLKLPLETLQYFRQLGKKHGFGLAGLVMNNREISDEEIQEIYNNSINLKKVQNL